MEPKDKDFYLKKLMRYCAYQDRCHQEVQQKLVALGADRDMAGEVMAELIAENFLNEQRFAISFAGGKFRLKSWGKNKIRFALESKNISGYCIDKALDSIPEDEYRNQLADMVRDMLHQNDELRLIMAKDRTLKKCTAKGFEIDLILAELRKY